MRNKHLSKSQPGLPCKFVLGVTSDQTCLVLRSRISALRQAGYEVILITSPGRILDQFVAETGVAALPVKMKREIAPFSDLLSLIALWRHLRRIHPHIAEFSTPKAGLLGSIAALLAGVPRRVYLLRGLKLETTQGFKRSILLLAERVAAACAHHVLCNSESLKALAVDLRIASASKITVLAEGSSAGVDLDRFQPGCSQMRSELDIPAHARLIGFVGRITRDKGIPELINAFEKIYPEIPNVYLLLVGWFDRSEDALDRNLVERIATHPRIRTTGYVQDTAPYYRAMDFLVLPSRREGFPNVALEAAATGLPVIATLCTGARDAVIPEVTGILVQPENPDDLAGAMKKLLCNAELRSRMGSQARNWARQHYSQKLVLREHLAFYQKIISADQENHKAVRGKPLKFRKESAS